MQGPYELLELESGRSVSLEPISWERGFVTIHPRWEGAPAEKEIEALRLHLREGTKAYPPMYYDVTSKTLIAQILPLLSERGFEVYAYIVTAFGVAPKKRFTLERRPL